MCDGNNVPFADEKLYNKLLCQILLMEQPITVRAILEILGSPAEHITKALKDHIETLRKDGTAIKSEKLSSPEQKENLFSQYAELVITFKDTRALLNFCFDSIPSSVEIMAPEKIDLPTTELEDLLNDFLAKLHHTDAMIKNLSIQKQVLDRNAVNILHNFIKHACTEKKTAAELAKITGIKEEDLLKFTDQLIERNILKKEGQHYHTNA